MGANSPNLETRPAPSYPYLLHLAAVKAAPTFLQYSRPDFPLPSTALLHGWIAGSMASVIEATPECKEHLPSSASTFFQHFSPASSSPSSSLQNTLSSLATKTDFEASLTRAKKMRRKDGGLSLAHLKS